MTTGPKPDATASMEALLPLVYAELRLLAGKYLHGDRAHTLQPTALVHEAFVKLAGGAGTEGASAAKAGGGSSPQWRGRDHFMAVASIAMRQVLVDHARRKTADKRGGGAKRLPLCITDLADDTPCRDLQVVQLDELLAKLARADARAARVAEMRLFGGMQLEQIGRALDVSRSQVSSDWRFARAWLAGKIRGTVPGETA